LSRPLRPFLPASHHPGNSFIIIEPLRKIDRPRYPDVYNYFERYHGAFTLYVTPERTCLALVSGLARARMDECAPTYTRDARDTDIRVSGEASARAREKKKAIGSTSSLPPSPPSRGFSIINPRLADAPRVRRCRGRSGSSPMRSQGPPPLHRSLWRSFRDSSAILSRSRATIARGESNATRQILHCASDISRVRGIALDWTRTTFDIASVARGAAICDSHLPLVPNDLFGGILFYLISFASKRGS